MRTPWCASPGPTVTRPSGYGSSGCHQPLLRSKTFWSRAVAVATSLTLSLPIECGVRHHFVVRLHVERNEAPQSGIDSSRSALVGAG
jgi:hypothetical protein